MSSAFLLFVIFIAFIAVMSSDAAYVEACAEVCDRISRERDACCRAHGYSGMGGCAMCY